MALNGSRTYIGFGLGAIQAGLFLYEAYQSCAFKKLLVVEVVPQVVSALQANDGFYHVNIAHLEHVEDARIGPVEIINLAGSEDREQIISAIAQAEEMGTAVPSVKFYQSDSPGSIHRLLAAGLRKKARDNGPRAVIYAAENHNHAAAILQDCVMGEIPAGEQDAVRQKVCFVNTVIGKMSGVITDPDEIAAQQLVAITPTLARAFLVEEFNRILISQITFANTLGEAQFERGLSVFTEKQDLYPFEEAKLYGHNATHALAAYLAPLYECSLISDLTACPGVLPFLRDAFLDESGLALVHKYRGLDALFTPEGYRAYADDLLKRMVNPHLHDLVERVGRDPERKLGWDDRLIGTARMVLSQGIQPTRYLFGAAAALCQLQPELLSQSDFPLDPLLLSLWTAQNPDPGELHKITQGVQSALEMLKQWIASGKPELDDWLLEDQTSS